MSALATNTSPLIALSGVHRLDLIKACCNRLLIPGAVKQEIVDQGVGWLEAADVQAAIQQENWIEVVNVDLSEEVAHLRGRLGTGETEAIQLALSTPCPVMLDDLGARNAASKLGLTVSGTLGILGHAKNVGIVTLPKVQRLIEEMKWNGIYFGDDLIERFIRGLIDAS